jgi:Secretion system C-terminal sorting domain
MQSKNRMIPIFLALLIVAPKLSFCQYLNKLYDIDSTYDWGWNIFVQSDNNFFILDAAQNTNIHYWWRGNTIISADGNAVMRKNIFKIDSAHFFSGDGGQAQRINGGYIEPISIQDYYGKSRGGLLKYNATGDTFFLKTYTDTTLYFDVMNTCASLQDGYLVGGERGKNVSFNYPGLVVRTDTSGNTLWTHTYQKDTSQWVQIKNIIPLADGFVALGTSTTQWSFIGSEAYTNQHAWFIMIDALGNIIKDTAYIVGFAGGGSLFRDSHGGFIHTGQIDTYVTHFVEDYENFPNYIAHLDTNFRMEWITRLPYTVEKGHRYTSKVIQLHDGNFLVCGEAARYGILMHFYGWAAKVDKSGSILWEQYYLSDSTHDAYFRDVAEKPNGNIVFLGASFNDTTPSWHRIQDVWLVEVDSNGCEHPFCAPVSVPQAPEVKEGTLSVYPNPNTGSFTIRLSAAANEPTAVVISSITGAAVQQFAGTTNKDTEVALHMPPGMYLISVTTASGRWVQKMVVE